MAAKLTGWEGYFDCTVALKDLLDMKANHPVAYHAYIHNTMSTEEIQAYLAARGVSYVWGVR